MKPTHPLQVGQLIFFIHQTAHVFFCYITVTAITCQTEVHLKKITKVAWTRHWRQTYTSERTADDTNTTAGYPPSIPPGWRARLWGNLYARQSRQKFIMYTEQRNSIEVWRLYLFCFSPKHLGMSPHASEAKMTSPCQCIINTRWEKRYTTLLFKKNNRKQIK